jgi:hypothetical protein
MKINNIFNALTGLVLLAVTLTACEKPALPIEDSDNLPSQDSTITIKDADTMSITGSWQLVQIINNGISRSPYYMDCQDCFTLNILSISNHTFDRNIVHYPVELYGKSFANDFWGWCRLNTDLHTFEIAIATTMVMSYNSDDEYYTNTLDIINKYDFSSLRDTLKLYDSTRNNCLLFERR